MLRVYLTVFLAWTIVGCNEKRSLHLEEGNMDFGRISRSGQPIRLDEWNNMIESHDFLQPIPGTPLEGVSRLSPRYCLKVLALFRLANPACELRIAAGREMHLGSLQPLGLYAANSIFVGDYLTTKGQPPSRDHQMIEALGFQPVVDGGK